MHLVIHNIDFFSVLRHYRNELCATGNVACGELGRAYVEAMCRPEYSCQVAYDSGVRGGFVIAHEAGHRYIELYAKQSMMLL